MKKSTTLVETGNSKLVARAYDLGLKMVPNLARVLTEEELMHWEKNLGGIQEALRRGFSLGQSNQTEKDWVKVWQNIYFKFHGFSADFSGIKISEKPTDGKWRLIIVAKGLTNNQVYTACEKHFKCYRYIEDLNSCVPMNDRDSKDASYAIWVKDTVEADEDLKDLSANQLKDRKITGITLMERMLLELQYFLETGKHMDILNWTLCSGSRDSDGSVPRVDWRGVRFLVDWGGPGDRSECLRARAVVS